MSSASPPVTDESYIISDVKRPDVEFELVDQAAGESYTVVGYADDILREKMRVRDPGSVIRADLAPADREGDTWLLTRLRPGSPPPMGSNDTVIAGPRPPSGSPAHRP